MVILGGWVFLMSEVALWVPLKVLGLHPGKAIYLHQGKATFLSFACNKFYYTNASY